MLRERQAGFYDLSAYFLAKMFSEAIPHLLSPIYFSLILYWMVGLQSSGAQPIIFIIFMMLTTQAAIALATAVSTIFRTSSLSVAILPMCLEVCRLFGGFFLTPAKVPTYFVWLGYLDYLQYAYMGVSLNEFRGLQYTCMPSEVVTTGGVKHCPVISGNDTINTNGFNKFSIGGCIGALVIYIFVCQLAAYLALRFLKSR